MLEIIMFIGYNILFIHGGTILANDLNRELVISKKGGFFNIWIHLFLNVLKDS